MKHVCLGKCPADHYSAKSIKWLNSKTETELADHFQTIVDAQIIELPCLASSVQMQKLASQRDAATIRI